jgi:hypothetical protein
MTVGLSELMDYVLRYPHLKKDNGWILEIRSRKIVVERSCRELAVTFPNTRRCATARYAIDAFAHVKQGGVARLNQADIQPNHLIGMKRGDCLKSQIYQRVWL